MFDVTQFGAVGDGVTNNTTMIQAGIDACSSAGGGTVYFPAGIYLSATLTIPSFITLHLATGATLLASTDMNLYPRDMSQIEGDRTGHHLLRFDNAQHVMITGGGIIDGQGPAFWDSPENPSGADCYNDYDKEHGTGKDNWRGFPLALSPHDQRPSPFLFFHQCTDIKLQNITIKNTPGWAIHLASCQRVKADGVNILNPMDGPNTDGFDIDGCKDVQISNCKITNGDDSIVIFASPDNGPSERITVTNCIFATRCAAIKVYTCEVKDEAGFSPSHAIRQITVNNCIFHDTERAVALYLWGDAIYEDMHFSNLIISTGTTPPNFAERPIQIDVGHDRHAAPDQPIGIMRNISFSDITIRTPGRIIFAARKGHLKNVRVSNLNMCITGNQDLTAYENPSPSTQQFCHEIGHVRTIPAHLVIHGASGLCLKDINIRDEAATALEARHGLYLEAVSNESIDGLQSYPLADGYELIKTA